MSSLQTVSDADMGVGFPERDFDGYTLFGSLEGLEPYKAIKMIVFLGGLDGFDWGMAHIPADSNFSFYELGLIGETEAYRRFQSTKRVDFRAARGRLDIHLDERLNLSGTWPSWRWQMSMPQDKVAVDLVAEAHTLYWSPNLVHKGTSWITCALVDFRYSGTVSIDGQLAQVRGVGTFDHPIGTLRPSMRSPGVGYWQWDCFAMSHDQGLFAWHAVDGSGEPLVSEAITSFPDGQRHLGQLTLEYTKFEQWGDMSVPAEWRCHVTADHGVFDYIVRAALIRPEAGAGAPGEALPNPLLTLDGTFTPTGGSSRRISGTGTGELIQSLLDPRTRHTKQPW